MSKGFSGLWTRSLLAFPDGRRDETTKVKWLQGPRLFADLRQPTGRPACCLTQGPERLSHEASQWLASQSGFAGVFSFQDGIAEWRREIDFQPRAALPDAGRLEWRGRVLVETGLHVPYLEHWHAGEEPHAPSFGLRLRSASDGRLAILVRSGPLFMLARDRAPGIALSGPDLLTCLAGAADPAAMRAILDCEISSGHVEPGWVIGHSTLPWREGKALCLSLHGESHFNLDGTPWEILHAEGDLSFT
ncbi:hypothetical protein [Acidocella sp.]|uniref:hypothetical protein n=1 Tax=Acidocella sp. TaxID=50710 RepID=UPI003D016734